MSVTTVPIRPLARGSVLKLWLAIVTLCVAGGALAWIGTAPLQIITTSTGVRFQTIRSGEGALITPADLVAMRYRLTKADGTLIEDSDQAGQPFVASVDRVFPGFGEAMQMMQQGGRYRFWLPPGQHAQMIPPGAPFRAEDTLVFEVRVLQVAEGMAAMQQMMGPPGTGGGAPPGGLPPGALPPGAEGLPPGAAPPGALPPGAEDLPPGAVPPAGPPPAGSERRRPGGR
ncbi:MAG: FKBP-type peptidyl-prolyl cis-trans isomerase [Sphingomonas sp.]